MSALADRATALRALHVPGDPLILVNVWDAASARAVAGVPGCRALASASHSIAAALGHGDGEEVTREAMLDVVATICAATTLPVSADLERGYAADAGGVRETIALALAAGAVGANIEDSVGDGLRPAAEAAARIAAARAAADDAGVPFVLNARTDAYLHGDGGPEDRLGLALERGRAYAEAGGDCIFVPGVRDPDAIRALADGMGTPVSVIAGPSSPPLAELAAAGVARISIGPGGMGIALAALAHEAAGLLAGGAPPAALGFRP